MYDIYFPLIGLAFTWAFLTDYQAHISCLTMQHYIFPICTMESFGHKILSNYKRHQLHICCEALPWWVVTLDSVLNLSHTHFLFNVAALYFYLYTSMLWKLVHRNTLSNHKKHPLHTWCEAWPWKVVTWDSVLYLSCIHFLFYSCQQRSLFTIYAPDWHRQFAKTWRILHRPDQMACVISPICTMDIFHHKILSNY